MHERVAAKRDRDVRRSGRDGAEEDQIAGRDVRRVHRLPYCKLILHVARQRDPVLSEDVLREAAAIETVWIGATPYIRRTDELHRERGNVPGARTLWQRAMGRLRAYASGDQPAYGLDLDALTGWLRQQLAELDDPSAAAAMNPGLPPI